MQGSQINAAVLLYTAVLSTICVHLVSGIICYQCLSSSVPECGVPFNSTLAMKYRVASCKSCRTDIIRIGGMYQNERVNRLCNTDLEKDGHDGCYDTQWGQECYCTTNLCNNYGLITPPTPSPGLACYVCNGTNGCSDQGFNKYAGKKEFGCSACYKTIYDQVTIRGCIPKTVSQETWQLYFQVLKHSWFACTCESNLCNDQQLGLESSQDTSCYEYKHSLPFTPHPPNGRNSTTQSPSGAGAHLDCSNIQHLIGFLLLFAQFHLL